MVQMPQARWGRPLWGVGCFRDSCCEGIRAGGVGEMNGRDMGRGMCQRWGTMIKEELVSLRNGYSRMVVADQIDRVREILTERRKRLAAIKTRKQAEAYRDEVAAKVVRCFGRYPGKTPLNACITDEIKTRRYRIEKLTFESRPGCIVTANLYIPAKRSGPGPAVLQSCGHTVHGKAEEFYQAACIELACDGFVVLIFDPIHQGERDQYYRLPEGDDLRKYTCLGHNMIGRQQELTGEFFGAWRAWDAVRALDYLISRPEVDPKQVAMTGNSGGGTMTTWMWPLDRRIRMAAPSCFVTSFLSNLENELPSDVEQYPPGALAEGLDMADFLIARAPDPAVLLSAKYDFFDRRGAEEAAAEISRIYQLLDASDSFEFFLGNNPHGFFPEMRNAMRTFFCRHFGMQPASKVTLDVRTPKELFATPKGQVVPIGAKPVQTLNAEHAERLRGQRKVLNPAGLRSQLAQLLGVPGKRESKVRYRVLRPDEHDPKRVVARYAVSTERRIEAILRKAIVSDGHRSSLDVEPSVRLYVPNWSTEADFLAHPLTIGLLKDLPLYGVDVRGIGESLPDETEEITHGYGMDYMAHGFELLMGRSFLGGRVFDLLRTCDLLRQEGAKEITLIGRGQGALLALFAAVLDDGITTAELYDAPISFEGWTKEDDLRWPAANCLRNVLLYFDLPDLYRAYSSRVVVHSQWSARQTPV